MSIAAPSSSHLTSKSVFTIGPDAGVRANPSYRLQTWQSLPEATRRRLSRATTDGGSVLVGTGGSMLAAKLVDDAGARLFTQLARPGPAPDELAPDQLVRLVLDAVLEIERDGRWLSGPLAYEALQEADELPEPVDRLSRLSYQAVERAGRMPLVDEDQLCARLYGFGRLPLSLRWTRSYPGPESVAALLDDARVADRNWLVQAGPDWLSYSQRGHATSVDGLAYKLYISPHLGELPAVLPVIADVLAASGAPHFKVGANAAGLLRPDKIVVYLVDEAQLTASAQALARALAGVRAHGVPFSAELSGEGLLSWGGDPPADAGPLGGGLESWRLSVCRQLGEHLAAAKRAPLHRLTPTRYALGRLAADSVVLPWFTPASLPAPGGLA